MQRSSLIWSGAMHLGIAVALAVAWPKSATMPTLQEPITVDIVDVADVPTITEQPKPSQEAAPQETIEASSATDTTAPETEPSPEAIAPPDATVKPSKTEKSDDKPNRLDASRLENLIDKNLKIAKRKPLNVSELAQTLEKDLAKNAVVDARAAATLQQLMDSLVSRCFNPPAGGEDVQRMTVTIRLRLDPQGRIVDPPVVVGQTGVTEGNRAYAQALAGAARRAVALCAPYSSLPANLAPLWAGQEMELVFDPSRLM